MSSAGNKQTENGGGVPLLVAFTIPNNAGNGAKLITLLKAAAGENVPLGSLIIGAKAPGVDPTVDRGAVVVASPRLGQSVIAGTDFTNHGSPSPAGEEIYFPSLLVSELYVRSASAAPVQALAILLP